MAFQTPILLILFNRPATTRQVFDSLRTLKPSKLYVAADGPRQEAEGDRARCSEAREVVLNGIDWDCEVKTLLREENLGCGRGVSSAIDWFFANEEMGIILEDDILAGPGFFPYAEELLDRYREDERVMMVSGFNHRTEWPVPGSYFFAYYGSVWGWATWKRAWDTYDFGLARWDSIKREGLLKKVLAQDDHYIRYRENLVDRVVNGELDTWDYQWGVARIIHSGLSAIPVKSLVTNIGFGEDATHTRDSTSPLSNTPLGSLRFPLEHNARVAPDRAFDEAFMRSLAGPPPTLPERRSFFKRIRGRI